MCHYFSFVVFIKKISTEIKHWSQTEETVLTTKNASLVFAGFVMLLCIPQGIGNQPYYFPVLWYRNEV